VETQGLKTTICGSFRRHLGAVGEAMKEFADRRVEVLSPQGVAVVGEEGGFLFLASDQSDDIGRIEDRHLACIARSDFVWLVAPDGYVGPTTALEIGFAAGSGVPIYCAHAPSELISGDGPVDLRDHVTVVSGIAEAVERASARREDAPGDSFFRRRFLHRP
jgi:hypothetical protein